MATPYEFVAREVHTQLPTARLAPDPNMPARLYHSASDVDYSLMHQSYPGGYPFYYPAQLTLPGRSPLNLHIATGSESINAFTRPDGELRQLLAHYGYWRIESQPNPAITDFWLLLLRLPDSAPQSLILPTAKLARLLSRAHDPEKFSLLMARAGFCFAGQPLTTANRLAVLQDAALLDTPENVDLKMDAHLNNWNQLLNQ